MLKLVLLAGGQSSEHEISLSSATGALQYLDRDKYEVHPVVIEKNGLWSLGVPTDNQLRNREAWPHLSIGEALTELKRREVEFVLILIHGEMGEDGTLQGLCKAAGWKFAGSDVLGSAVAMDKTVSMELLAHHNLPVPKSVSIFKNQNLEERSRLLSEIGLPCFVKPADLGSSVGAGAARNEAERERALAESFAHSDHALVQELLEGTELSCGVIEKDGDLLALPPTEIIPQTSGFFDYHAKYTPGASIERTPAQIPESMTQAVQAYARETHKILRLKGFSRTDFILTARGPVILEANSLPGMTPTSLLPQQAGVLGITYSDLLDLMIESGLK